MAASGDRRVLNVAHRGASSVAPPNTLSAVRRAYELGADGVEFDVRLSRDRVPVVIHDATVPLARGGKARVADLTLRELKEIDVGSQFASAFRGERIPTLQELLTSARGHLLLNVELKTAGLLDTALVRATVTEIRHLRMEGSVLISSFNPLAVLQAKGAAPEIPAGLLGARRLGRLSVLVMLARLARIEAVHPEHTSVDSSSSARARKHGLRLHTWTVDDSEEMRRLIDLGVDGIITNFPQVLQGILHAPSPKSRTSSKGAIDGRAGPVRSWLNRK
jgi:glycerophosphoryl diester phosphodiesterase